MLGTNLTGDERVCLANKQNTDYYVKLVFEDNQNVQHTLIRYKDNYNSTRNFISLDGKIVKQEDLIPFYHNRNLFLAIINLSYFVGLQPAKQKELVDKYLPNVELKTVYDKLSDEEKNILKIVPQDIKLYLSELDSEAKFIKNKVANLKGQIDYAEKITNEILVNPPPFEKQQELDFALQELEHLKSEKSVADRTELQKKLKELQDEELELTLDITKLDKELQNGKNTYQKMLNQAECKCPTCNQLLNNNDKIIAAKQYRNELMTIFDKQTKLKERYKRKHFDKIACEGKILSLENSNDLVSSETLKQLEENIRTLELEKQENSKLQNEYSIKLNNIQQAKNDIEKLTNDIKTLNISLSKIQKEDTVAKQLYFNSIKEKMKIADKYLRDVKIRFYKVLKSCEIKDDFVITYKDKDFSTLSRSEKVAASLELANMLNKITNLDLPLFIDDSESYPDFDFISMYKDSQIFIAQVKKGRTLRITNKKTQHIKGFKSDINLHKKSNTQKQLVSVA